MIEDQTFELGVSCTDGSDLHTMTYMGSDAQENWKGDDDKKTIKQWFCTGCGMRKYQSVNQGFKTLLYFYGPQYPIPARGGAAHTELGKLTAMCDNELKNIADSIGTVTEEQNEEDKAREGEEFDPEDYHRDREDEYEGNR